MGCKEVNLRTVSLDKNKFVGVWHNKLLQILTIDITTIVVFAKQCSRHYSTGDGACCRGDLDRSPAQPHAASCPAGAS